MSESPKTESNVEDSSKRIITSSLHFAQWLAIAILASWLWVVDASHPPVALMQQIGRIEGKLDGMLDAVSRNADRVEAVKKELDTFSEEFVRKDELPTLLRERK